METVVNQNKTFDLVFSNPPYNNNIDLKILKEVVPIADEIIVIHPGTWIIDIKNTFDLYKSFRKMINGKVRSINVFNGNPIFNIFLSTPTMITHIDKTYNGSAHCNYFGDEFIEDDIFEITKFGSSWKEHARPMYAKIKRWLAEEGNGSVWAKRVSTDTSDGKHYCQLADILGGVKLNDETELNADYFYNLTMNDWKNNRGIRKVTIQNTYSFDTADERDNFLKYCQTDFARYCTSFYKHNSTAKAGLYSILPMLDFTEEWDDKKLYKYFDINGKTQKYINEFLPDFHNIRRKEDEV